LICFFCLRRTTRPRIINYYPRQLGMRFRVYACEKCARLIESNQS